MTTVIFSHGQESGPWGTKIRAMAELAKGLGCNADSIDYQGIADPTERVHKLIADCGDIDDTLILVGSSMGGHVATAAAAELGAAGLFVLAPAYFMPGYEDLTPKPPQLPIAIVHGWRDDVVPYAGSVRYGEETGATVTLLDSDHRLTSDLEHINRLFAEFLTRMRADA